MEDKGFISARFTVRSTPPSASEIELEAGGE